MMARFLSFSPISLFTDRIDVVATVIMHSSSSVFLHINNYLLHIKMLLLILLNF